ncbi:Retrovirus-related Pol polyprotein from transposon TNT 1-94 [Cucumis melo var. makuwa]|uniref:Retrovirus-related Pol polyprotein from transposon TNT 1-94 n=1 Tax=Cucumis melo var. makuwa TaxID=1194695 RepID=A0A5A7V153_CUCMM|nr:Retrovirus-related Pol polyprotein from transposon TNT 1-94 [Cucumis melo var. makuwa]TYK00767.1 Retrovirus-related Pol polyprotein from transposon TNT 1-94 [Cucumis melo var. makuwa]
MDLCRETVWDTPNDDTQYAKLEEIDHVYDFLAGLNPKFDTVCGCIRRQRPLLSLMETLGPQIMIVTRKMGSQSLCASTARNNCTQKNSVGNSTVVSQKVRNDPPTRNRTQDVPTLVRLPLPELLNQLVPTANQTKTLTLGAIAQSTREERLALSGIAGDFTSLMKIPPVVVSLGDVWGPSKVTTPSGKRWFVTFIDDHTRLTWVYLITDKSEVSSIFQNFYHTIETQFHTKIAILRSDNGREFQNHNLSEFLASKGIVHHTSCAYTQQNGVAERKNCHLVEVARSLMLSTSLPAYLWGDAILTTAHLINRMPSRILHLQTPLNCLKESYPSTHLVSERGYKCFHPPSRKYLSLWMLLSLRIDPTFLLVIFKGRVNEESNSTFEFIEPTPSTVSDIDPHPRKGTRTCTKHRICNYVSYDNLSPQFRAFTANIDSTILPKNIYTALECPEWKNVVMEEMRLLKRIELGRSVLYPKDIKS